MNEVIKKIEEMLPADALVKDIVYEGANIVLYTLNEDFFLNSKDLIKEIVDTVKKRIEVRMDYSKLLDPEKAEELIREIVPKNAELRDVWFDTYRGVVIIEVLHPKRAIGKDGEVLQKIKEKTLWTPKIRRALVIPSDLVRGIRTVLFENSSYRRNFMHQIGKKIYETKWQRDSRYFVRLSFLGGVREVGRSCILLQTPYSNVLLDCGVDVATDNFPRFDAPEFSIDRIDAVIITHAHLDHSGAVPLLYKYGYKGPVYMTEPTRDIMTLLLLDFIEVAQREGKKPPFTSKEIREMIKHSISLRYNEVTDITPDVRITFYKSGHVLGGAMVHLNVGNGLHNILYTGDFKFIDTKLLEKADNKFQRLETLVIESTYGGQNDIQPERKECEEEMIKIISKTIERGGKVLIPVLGVGRAQDVMLIVEEGIRKGKIPKTNVYLDGMVWDVTAIHSAYPEFLHPELRKRMARANPFLSEVFKRVGSPQERMKVIESSEPCVIIATSGMLTGGASLEYFYHLCENKNNSIIFVSYQAEKSLGRKVQSGVKEIQMERAGKVERLKINMEVHSVEGLSGHSDRKQLEAFVSSLSPKPKRALVVHGERSKCIDLASTIHKMLKIETQAPRLLDAFRIR